MVATIWIIQGPNLNLLGEREPELYGTMSLTELQNQLDEEAKSLDLRLKHFQSNHEGQLIDQLQAIRSETDGVLLNAGGLTHTSVSLHDTIKAVSYPVVEVHLTDPSNRDFFRRTSYLTDVCVATFKGNGIASYSKGLRFLKNWINGIRPEPKTNSRVVFRKNETIHLDDTDAAGIIFNANLFRICHRVNEEWLSSIQFSIGKMLQERKWGLPVVHWEGDFLRPLQTSQSVTIELEIIRIGASSMTYGYRILDEQSEVCATASSVHVATDFSGNKVPIPSEFINSLNINN